ncbi:MAG: hypothetical protein WBL25_03085, partial [Anaerolineales bacterium]
ALMFEMNKNAAEVFVVFFHPVIESFDMFLIKKTQNLFLQLPAAFAGDDLNQLDVLVDSFLNDAVQFRFDLIAPIVNFV